MAAISTTTTLTPTTLSNPWNNPTPIDGNTIPHDAQNIALTLVTGAGRKVTIRQTSNISAKLEMEEGATIEIEDIARITGPGTAILEFTDGDLKLNPDILNPEAPMPNMTSIVPVSLDKLGTVGFDWSTE